MSTVSYLKQLIDLQNEKLDTQAATLRHLQNELRKWQGEKDGLFNYSLFSSDIGEKVNHYGETWIVTQVNRSEYKITLQKAPNE